MLYKAYCSHLNENINHTMNIRKLIYLLVAMLFSGISHAQAVTEELARAKSIRAVVETTIALARAKASLAAVETTIAHEGEAPKYTVEKARLVELIKQLEVQNSATPAKENSTTPTPTKTDPSSGGAIPLKNLWIKMPNVSRCRNYIGVTAQGGWDNM